MSVTNRRSDTRILLVEDEAIIALDLAQRLEGLGYEVAGTAASGAEALDLAQSTSPTLVFMDIMIQGPMDGIETAKRLNSRMDVPIVFLTSHSDTGTIRRAKSANPYGYLVKPFEERELLTTIEMAVSRHQIDVPARLLQQAMASAGIGMVLASATDPAFAITVCNQAFLRLSGYESGEVVGRSPWLLEGPGTDAGARAALRRALHEQTDCQVTCRLHRKDGAAFPAALSVSPVRNPIGEATHFLLCLSDAAPRRPDEGLA